MHVEMFLFILCRNVRVVDGKISFWIPSGNYAGELPSFFPTPSFSLLNKLLVEQWKKNQNTRNLKKNRTKPLRVLENDF